MTFEDQEATRKPANKLGTIKWRTHVAINYVKGVT